LLIVIIRKNYKQAKNEKKSYGKCLKAPVKIEFMKSQYHGMLVISMSDVKAVIQRTIK